MSRKFEGICAALAVGLCVAFALACGGGGGSGHTPGDLAFESVSSPSAADTGDEIDVSATLWAQAAKYNVYIGVALESLPAGGLDGVDPNALDFEEDYEIGGMHVAEMIAGEVATAEGQVVVPVDLPAGDYAVIFKINELDYTGDDDHLQSEKAADLANNITVSSTVLTVTAQDAPQLRIADDTAIENSSFYQKTMPTGEALDNPTYEAIRENGDLIVYLEVESESYDVDVPVEVKFEIGIPDGVGGTGWHDLDILTGDADWNPAMSASYEFAVDAETGHSIEAGTFVGTTILLYLDAAAWDALDGKAEDTQCTLRITVDPDNDIAEYNGEDVVDNVQDIDVVYLVDQAAKPGKPSVRKVTGSSKVVLDGHEYDNRLLSKTWSNSHGKTKYFKSKVDCGATLSYGTTDSIPTRANANVYGEVYAWIFNHKFQPLFAGADLDYDIDSVTTSHFTYEVKVLGTKYLGDTYDLGGDERTIWSRDWGKSKKEGAHLTYWLGPVPIKISAGFEGEVGIGGDLKLKAENLLELDFGPYIDLSAYGSCGVDLKLAGADVDIKMTILKITQTFSPRLQIQITEAAFEFEGPISVSTLGGKLYAHAWVHAWLYDKDWYYTICKWHEHKWNLNWFSPQKWTYN